jgi:hypothetical protein
MDAPLQLHWARDFTFTGAPSTGTISKDRAGRSWVVLRVAAPRAGLPVVQARVGGDLGLPDLVVLRTGE